MTKTTFSPKTNSKGKRFVGPTEGTQADDMQTYVQQGKVNGSQSGDISVKCNCLSAK